MPDAVPHHFCFRCYWRWSSVFGLRLLCRLMGRVFHVKRAVSERSCESVQMVLFDLVCAVDASSRVEGRWTPSPTSDAVDRFAGELFRARLRSSGASGCERTDVCSNWRLIRAAVLSCLERSREHKVRRFTFNVQLRNAQ